MIPSAVQSVNSIMNTLHNVAASHTPVEVGIGIILAPPPEIKVAYNNIILEKQDLFIDQFLLPNYQRNLKGAEKISKAEGNIKTVTDNRHRGGGDPSFYSHNHKINSSYKANVEGEYTANAIFIDCGLVKGDKVSLLPVLGGQKFIILGKIIAMTDIKAGKANDDISKSLNWG